jgi:rhodanese-related sulfurtransferase
MNMRVWLRSARSGREFDVLGRVALLALLLTVGLLLAACSSGGAAETTSSAAPGASNPTTSSAAPGASNPTTSSAAPGPVAGAPGSGGVGKVVAAPGAVGTYIDITPDELAVMLENKDFLLINTHIPYEGEIEQTDLFLPYDQAAQQLDQLPADKDAKIVVYCRSDRMSRISVEEWVKAGYTNLYNLDGGFVAWEAAGYELLRK